MSDHVWRQGYGRDPMREWMRREFPGGKDGLVLVDLDLAVRRYGPKYDLDAEGDLMLIEKKEYAGKLTYAEGRVYGWIGKGIEGGVYEGRYRGFFLLRVVYRDEPDVCEHCHQPIENEEEAYKRFATARLFLDDKEITHDELRKLIEGNILPRVLKPEDK